MIATGKYKVHINHMFFDGDAVFEIEFDDGNYEIEIEIEDSDFDMSGIKIVEYTEEDDTLDAKATIPLLPGKEIDLSLTFEDNKCNGFIKIPFVGKMKIKDAVKI